MEGGGYSERSVVSTEYVSIDQIVPPDSMQGPHTATVALTDAQLISCTVSTWTEEPIVHVYPVLIGPRDQWYPTPCYGELCCLVCSR